MSLEGFGALWSVAIPPVGLCLGAGSIGHGQTTNTRLQLQATLAGVLVSVGSKLVAPIWVA